MRKVMLGVCAFSGSAFTVAFVAFGSPEYEILIFIITMNIFSGLIFLFIITAFFSCHLRIIFQHVGCSTWWLVGVFAIISNVLFGLSLVFYNAYLGIIVRASPKMWIFKGKANEEELSVVRCRKLNSVQIALFSQYSLIRMKRRSATSTVPAVSSGAMSQESSCFSSPFSSLFSCSLPLISRTKLTQPSHCCFIHSLIVAFLLPFSFHF